VSTDFGTITGGTCTVGGSTPCTVIVNSNSTGVAHVNVGATVTVGGVPIDVATDGYGAFDIHNTKTWVDARIHIEADAVNPVGSPHTFTVTTLADPGTGTFSAASGTVTSISTDFGTITGGTCTVGGSTPCTVIVNSNSVGTAHVNVGATVTVGGVPIDVATDGYGAFDIHNTKTWVGARIHIEDNSTNQVGNAHTFSVTTQADTGGGFQDVSGAVTSVTTDFGNITGGTCTLAGATTPCTVIVNSNSTGVAHVNVSATVMVDGVPLDVATNGDGAFDIRNTKTWVDARIHIEDNSTNQVGNAHTFTVTTQADPGTGTFGAASGTVTSVTTDFGTITGGTCTVGGSTPCTVIVNSNSTGTAHVNVGATVTVGGVPIDVATNGYGAFDIRNTKTWVDARIHIEADSTNQVGNAHTFNVSTAADPGTGTFSAASGTVTSISTDFGNITGGTCTVGGSTPCTVIVNSNSTGVAHVNVGATVTVGGVPIAVATNGYGAFDIHNTKTWVDARIHIEDNSINPAGSPHTFSVSTAADPGTGTFSAASGTVTSISTDFGNITGGTCTVGGSTPCTVIVNSTTAGTAHVTVHATVTVGGVPIAVATDGYGAFDIRNTKIWADDTVVTHVRDAGGADLTGSTTITPGTVVHDEATVTKTAGTPASVPAPTGTVTFQLFNGNGCNGTLNSTSTGALNTSGLASSATFTTPSTAGGFSYLATYNGDANYPSRTAGCENFTTSAPAGPALTPGFWKNHPAATTALLPITLGNYNVNTFAKALAIFNAMQCNTPIDCLAGHELAAKLDRAQTPPSSPSIDPVLAQADALLVQVNYNGPGKYTTPTAAQKALALQLETVIDAYTNQ
jgi:hypothetical protein